MNCKLVMISSGLGEAYPLRDGVTTIGRDVESEMQFLDDGVSRNHAKIDNLPNLCEIEDCGSSNGTFVNGDKIAQPTLLKHGDEVRMGEIVLIFEEMDREDSDGHSMGRDYSDYSMRSTVFFKKGPDGLVDAADEDD